MKNIFRKIVEKSKISKSQLFRFFLKNRKFQKVKNFRKTLKNIIFRKTSRSKKTKFFIENCMKMKIFEIEKSRFFGPIFFLHTMRTQTDRAPRDLNGIASDQNVVKIMVFYFPKIYGFPMLRSNRSDQILELLSSHP